MEYRNNEFYQKKQHPDISITNISQPLFVTMEIHIHSVFDNVIFFWHLNPCNFRRHQPIQPHILCDISQPLPFLLWMKWEHSDITLVPIGVLCAKYMDRSSSSDNNRGKRKLILFQSHSTVQCLVLSLLMTPLTCIQ